MKEKMVSDLINDQIKKFNSICDELTKLYGKEGSSECIRRISLKSKCQSYYDMIHNMLIITMALDDSSYDECSELDDALYETYKRTYYGL